MNFNNPAKPHKEIVHNQDTDKNKSNYLQKTYRYGIGLLIYLVKHPQPE